MTNSNIAERLAAVAQESTLILTHYGRKSGKPYDVAIWFTVEGEAVFLATINVNRQWVRNVKARPDVILKVGHDKFTGRIQVLTDSAELERIDNMRADKYLAARIFFWIARPLSAFILNRHAAFKVTITS